jgi:hypothetical protein
MSREKKITGHITGYFFNDSKKIASQYFKEVKTGKKTIKKNDFIIIFIFFLLFSVMMFDLIFQFSENEEIFIYGGTAVIGIFMLLLSKSIKKQ